MVSDLLEPMLGDDWPVFDRQCKCGRFMKLPKTVKFRVGDGSVVEAKGQCARCWSCMLPAENGSNHYDPHEWHTWADAEDIEHALKTGQDDPSNQRCGCWCATEAK